MNEVALVNSRFPLDFEQIIGYTKSVIPHAGVVELADARDSKSRVRKDVRVRPPPPAPHLKGSQSLEMAGFAGFFLCFARLYTALLHHQICVTITKILKASFLLIVLLDISIVAMARASIRSILLGFTKA